jgi:hypothetical protein
MTMFDHFNWVVFCKNLAGCIGIGALSSLAIALNVRTQNKFRAEPGFRSKLIQWATFLGSNGILFPIVVFYFSAGIIDGKNASALEVVLYFVGLVMPAVFAFLSGIIPKTPEKTKHEGA